MRDPAPRISARECTHNAAERGRAGKHSQQDVAITRHVFFQTIKKVHFIICWLCPVLPVLCLIYIILGGALLNQPLLPSASYALLC